MSEAAALEPVTIEGTVSRWRPQSVALIVLVWLILHIGCLFTPGLLDDVDSIYIEVAREMMVRHDYVTPYVDGIRFFDKPPLMYWLAAGSMHLFGVVDWAARLPLALLTLALFLAVYALGLRLFRGVSAQGREDRGALYAALALATGIGPFLYTRFFIPDILICLWMTVAVHALLVALECIREGRSGLAPSLAFAAATALNLLTKGLVGVVFPLGFAVLYLAFTGQFRLLRKLPLGSAAATFFAIAAPWHVLAALRNPAIPLPPGLGLPARGGWAWFYLYNEHVARFLSRRIPHDYGQVPVPLFWLLAAIWIFPWTAFLFSGVRAHIRDLQRRHYGASRNVTTSALEWSRHIAAGADRLTRDRDAAWALPLWTGLVMVFFTLSARQEYYSLPALPALALMAGGVLARSESGSPALTRNILAWHRWMLVPLGSLCAAVALFFAVTAPYADPHTDITTLLAQGGDYNLSLSHIFDLTGRAMGRFRGPLAVVGLSMLTLGPVSYGLRRAGRLYAANLLLAAAAGALLLCMHEGLVRFYPTLGSKPLAEAIVAEQQHRPRAGDVIAIDGELTSGSTLLFYTRQPVHLVDGRINGPWYGSFWPDAPEIFETDATLRRLWSGPERVFLLTCHPEARVPELASLSAVRVLASGGGKSILTNR